MSLFHRLTHRDCVSDLPGHVAPPDAVARAARSEGTPWRLTRVGAHSIHLVDASGRSAIWHLHDPRPFRRHRFAADPTVWVHDDGLVRLGDTYVSVAPSDGWLPCEDVAVRRRPDRKVAWLIATGRPAVDDDLAALVPPHTATLYHLEPPLEIAGVAGRGSDAAPVDWVLVLAYHHRGRGVTAVYEADATGRILSDLPLPGSHTDGTDHVSALRFTGYEVELAPPQH